MKKAKFMLTAPALMAVVGGALAFNVQSRNLATYCITGNGTTCSSLFGIGRAAAGGSVSYATTTSSSSCDGVECTGTGSLFVTE